MSKKTEPNPTTGKGKPWPGTAYEAHITIPIPDDVAALQKELYRTKKASVEAFQAAVIAECNMKKVAEGLRDKIAKRKADAEKKELDKLDFETLKKYVAEKQEAEENAARAGTGPV